MPGLDTPLQPALGDAEFGEVVTTYLGMESPALRGLAGRSIPCGHRRHTVCDAHGFQLGLATLPGPCTRSCTMAAASSCGA